MKRTVASLLTGALICLTLTACGASTLPVENGFQESPDTEMSSQTDKTPKPVYGSQIKDGTYTIDVTSSSSMFRIIGAQLTVEKGEMWAVITLSGNGYEKLYMGTGEQALADSKQKFIPFVENSEGKYTYKVPVTALNQEIDCAAWSKKKQKWYDRTLVFQSQSIPGNAITAEAERQFPEDGQYMVEVTLSGGSGKVTVKSPTKLTVVNGKATATITWGSSNYDYMLVNGKKYKPINTEGNSVFEIPVALDVDLHVTANTVAMSTPHEIEYTLRFDSGTLKR